jgi:hypothetical protein
LARFVDFERQGPTMTSDVVFACPAGEGLDDLTAAARLLMSLRWFGGSVANAKFVLGCAEPIPGEADRLFRQFRSDVVRIPFDPASSGRIELLGSPAVAGHEVVVLLDPNTLITGDPAQWLDVPGFAASIKEEEVSPGRSRSSVDTGVVVVAASHRGRLAEVWAASRRSLADASGSACGQDLDRAGLALAVETSDIFFRALPEEMNLVVSMTAGACPAGARPRSPAIIQYHGLGYPTGFLRPPLHPCSAHIEAFNARLRASGHACLPAAREIMPKPRKTEPRRPKVVVGSGWWCDREPHQWAIGGASNHSIAFFDVWYRQVMRCLGPDRIVVTDSASPVKPDHRSYAGIQWIELDQNYGHPNDIRVGKVRTKYSGFTRSLINGAMYALCCDADFYVYVEQDCLVHGDDFLAQAIGEATEDILVGTPTENGRGLFGKVAASMIQQSLVVVARSGLERFLDGLLGAPWTDGERSPEQTMRHRLAPYGFLQVPYGRSRPIDFARSHIYAQHLTDEELAEFLAHTGIELPERSFPFRADDLGGVGDVAPASDGVKSDVG